MAEEIREKIDEPVEERPPQSPAAAQTHTREERRSYRSLFWPLVLIGAGVLFLLINVHIIDAINLTALYRLWPILLIAIGLDVLFGRNSPVLGALLGLAAVGAVVALVIVGPQLGLTNDNAIPVLHLGDMAAEVKHGQYSEAVGGADSANVTLDTSSIHTEINSLPAGSDTLFLADVDYLGTMEFNVEGGAHRSISLNEDRGTASLFAPPGSDMRWEIGLNPDVPTDLTLDTGSGSINGDLSSMTLSDFEMDSGSGSVDLSLPGGSYDAQISSGSGSVRLDIADGAVGEYTLDTSSGSVSASLGLNSALDIRVTSGSGGVSFDLPSGGAFQVIVEDVGSGSVNLSNMLHMVDDGGDDDPRTGTWQTTGFDTASIQTTIRLEDLGSGSVNIR